MKSLKAKTAPMGSLWRREVSLPNWREPEARVFTVKSEMGQIILSSLLREEMYSDFPEAEAPTIIIQIAFEESWLPMMVAMSSLSIPSSAMMKTFANSSCSCLNVVIAILDNLIRFTVLSASGYFLLAFSGRYKRPVETHGQDSASNAVLKSTLLICW